MRLSSLLLVLALPLVGCASLPEGPPVAPTGEPLSVREKTETALVNERVKVGEVEHKNSYGQTVARSDVYANQTRMVHYQVWSAYQGEQKIADDDLYRIANDKAASAEVMDKRESGVTLNRIGLGILAAGVVGMVGGYALSTQSKPDQPSYTGTYLMVGSGLAASVGGLLAYFGKAKASAEHPLEQDRAHAAAASYNRALATGSAPVQTTGASYPQR